MIDWIKAKIEPLKWRLVGILGNLFIEGLFRTIRIEAVGFDKIEPIIASNKFIGAFWHSRILILSHLHKKVNSAIMVSASKDGEIIASILQQQGYQTIRGSTSRGGVRALASMVRAMKTEKKCAAIVPDGPRGPRFVVQPGVIALAKKTGYPILSVTYSAKRMKVFSSWDRFILPYPFTRCRVIYGKPVQVPADTPKQDEEKFRRQLQNELCRITREADMYFGHSILKANNENPGI